VRVIATSSIETQGRVLDELLDRLNIIPIAIPPLRERPADIVPLAERFLCRHRRRAEPEELSVANHDALMGHDWPGNAAELEKLIRHALRVSSGARLELHFATRRRA
jgi:two-component system response regulator FlrC